MKTKIYALKDEDGRIRYIGKTSNSLSRRLSGHLSNVRCGKINHRYNWIRSILSRGFLPTINLIEEIVGDGSLEEIMWIKYFRDKGIRLMNETDGGEGSLGHICSKKTRRKLSEAHKGKHRSAETIKKIREKNKGKHRSAEVCRKMSEMRKGQPNGRKGTIQSIEARKKISEAMRDKPWTIARRMAQINRHKE